MACALLLSGQKSHADDNLTELKAKILKQGKELQELKQQLDAKVAVQQTGGQAQVPASPPLDDSAVKKIVSDYLKDNPGAGMPPSVQTGYSPSTGFAIRSAPNPNYVKWDDDSRIPFELRIRGRLMMSYMNYRVTDSINHVTNQPFTANSNTNQVANFSQLEAKRINLIFQGTVWDPDLRYNINLLGNTRGLVGIQNNKVIQNVPTGGTAPNAAALSPLGGTVVVDHAVTLFEAFIAYDMHGCACEKGCGEDCPEGSVKYCPTYTLIAGKMKPFFGLDEFLGNHAQQFVDFSMADILFSSDDDSRLMGAGTQIKAFEDRFFLMSILTNGSDGTIGAATANDTYPGLITGIWYDLGGSWNEQRKAWDLWGDCIADVDYSCKPVVRIGGCVDLMPFNRRSLYGDQKEARIFVMPAAPNGTRLINLLNGDLAAPGGAHDVDMFDAYTYNAFVAAKYHGFSVCNEWWLRDLDNFRTTPNGQGNIIYQDSLGPKGASANALFPTHALLDYGMTLQAGYFLVPKKLEVAARWSMIRGESGDINGLGTFHLVNVPGVGKIQAVDGAFRQFHEADEYTVGVNYYFKRQLLKWQSDFGIYRGGNPSAAGLPITGAIAGSDGWLLRTQIQLFF
jgi:hypothetical protein